jgi:hypothetical protein
MFYVYEPQYRFTGWYDDSGKTAASWFDRDLTSDSSGTTITLVVAQASFFVNQSVIFAPPPLTVEIFPALFVNQSIFFQPTSVTALDAPDQMLKNEVKRVR